MEESSAESGRRFTAAGTIDKPILRGYGKLISRRMQGRRIVFTVCGCILLLCCLLLLALPTVNNRYLTYLFGFLGWFYCLYSMNFDVLISARLIRQIKKKNVADVTYSFDEDRFTAENRLSSSTLRYEAVESLADCPGFYALFQQKNAALLIPKAGLPEGEQPVFAAFLQEKTGRVLRKYTQKPRKLFPRVLAALLLTALLIGAFIFLPHADELLNSRPQAFTKDGFSLTLTEAFTEEDAGGYCAFYAASQQAEVWVFTDDLTNYPYAPADAKAYAGEMAADYGEEGAPLQEGLLPNGAYYVAYTELWEDGSYYTVDAVFQEDGVFTVVEFSCPKESRRFYEPRFLQWAQSVSLNSLLSL